MWTAKGKANMGVAVLSLQVVVILILMSVQQDGGMIMGNMEKLFLTPLIKSGKIIEAQEQAKDNAVAAHLKSSANKKLSSYSGFLTINQTTNSNLFFWFFPALVSLTITISLSRL
jgi:hypothetical protein